MRVKRAVNHQGREGLVSKGSPLTRAVISLENCSPRVREAGREKGNKEKHTGKHGETGGYRRLD